MEVTNRAVFVVCAVGLIGCVGQARSSEPSMTAGEHDREAEAHSAQAHAHASQSEPYGNECELAQQGACWSSLAQKRGKHAVEADKHAAEAAKHRKASEELRQVESEVCKGLSDIDRDLSPFAHREDIRGASKLVRKPAPGIYGGQQKESLMGATVEFLAVQGMTEQWMERVLECHLARNRVIGEKDTMQFCPLAVPDVEVDVRAVEGGFAVDISSEVPEAAEEVWGRVKKLK